MLALCYAELCCSRRSSIPQFLRQFLTHPTVRSLGAITEAKTQAQEIVDLALAEAGSAGLNAKDLQGLLVGDAAETAALSRLLEVGAGFRVSGSWT